MHGAHFDRNWLLATTVWIFSSTVISGVHNAIEFIFQFSMLTIHFLHFLFPALALTIVLLTGRIRLPSYPQQTGPFLALVASQCLISWCTASLISATAERNQYSLRTFDFIGTMLLWIASSTGRTTLHQWGSKWTCCLFTLAVCASLAWFPGKVLNCSGFAMANSIGVNAGWLIQVQALDKMADDTKVNIPGFLWLFFCIESLVLLLAHLFFHPASYFEASRIPSEIEIGILLVCAVFMTCMTFSKFSIMATYSSEVIIATRHFKYILGGIGSWFSTDLLYFNAFMAIGACTGIAAAAYTLKQFWVTTPRCQQQRDTV